MMIQATPEDYARDLRQILTEEAEEPHDLFDAEITMSAIRRAIAAEAAILEWEEARTLESSSAAIDWDRAVAAITTADEALFAIAARIREGKPS